MISVWVITKEYNQYDQYGEYFCKVFKDKPSLDKCKEFLLSEGYISDRNCGEFNDSCAKRLSVGGGRFKNEDVWYNLFEEFV